MYDLIFTSTQEILEYINSKTFNNQSSKRQVEAYFCSYTWNETLNFMTNGWPISKKIRIEAENIEKSLEAPHGYKYETTGEILDVGTFLTGKPECWLEPDMVDNRKVYKIIVNCGYTARVPDYCVVNSGTAIVSLVDLLQEEGNIVELEIVNAVNNIMDKKLFTLKFEIGTSPLDIDKLSFMIANPGFLRRITFAIKEVFFNVADCNGYGDSTDIVINKQKEPNTIYFPSLTNTYDRFRTLESSKLEVERILNQIKGGV